ncbi:hypothetical protein [Halarchaeum sp. P4]|uniref:hypothetical protein n=1 Tax=Halarchaeum sp. P4 TaxID=3421639 RepID=UPI003EB6F6B4
MIGHIGSGPGIAALIAPDDAINPDSESAVTIIGIACDHARATDTIPDTSRNPPQRNVCDEQHHQNATTDRRP